MDEVESLPDPLSGVFENLVRAQRQARTNSALRIVGTNVKPSSIFEKTSQDIIRKSQRCLCVYSHDLLPRLQY